MHSKYLFQYRNIFSNMDATLFEICTSFESQMVLVYSMCKRKHNHMHYCSFPLAYVSSSGDSDLEFDIFLFSLHARVCLCHVADGSHSKLSVIFVVKWPRKGRSLRESVCSSASKSASLIGKLLTLYVHRWMVYSFNVCPSTKVKLIRKSLIDCGVEFETSFFALL